MSRLIIKAIDLYQRRLSPALPPACVFFPTCSEYTRQAVEKYGAAKGVFLGVRRILRCHPWQKRRIDPLP